MESKGGDKRIILIAMDGSKHADNAFKWYAENLHKKTDEVWLTHCAEQFHLQPTDLLGANETSAEELYQENIKKSKDTAARIQETAQKHQINAKLCQLHGYPGHSIIQAAEEKNASMIICGSRGLGLFRRTIMGSISEYILHHAHMPVIVCKHEDEQKRIKHGYHQQFYSVP